MGEDMNEALIFRLPDLGGLSMDLRDLLGYEVDVTTEAGLRPRLAQRVLADAVDL